MTLIDPVSAVVPAGMMSRHEQPVIQLAGGVELRPWQQTDASALVASSLDPAIRQWNRVRPLSPEEARQKIARWHERWRTESAAVWAICRTADEEILGLIGLGDIDLHGGSAEYLYWVLPAARGTGVATHATVALSRWAFDDLGLHRLQLTHSTANEASCRVATKAGFELEGTMRSALLHADGWHDEHLHARVRGDE
ncbi:GNAT family protein [Streptomyces sp. Edi2]|uniref:GNAT family N-acetyltransferase n=1 Tax=Streptomyces sp. Edi2 TaxID=3162528 RepID=UPI003306531F